MPHDGLIMHILDMLQPSVESVTIIPVHWDGCNSGVTVFKSIKQPAHIS